MLRRATFLFVAWIAGAAALDACGGLAASTVRTEDAATDGTIAKPDASSNIDADGNTGDDGEDTSCFRCDASDASDAPMISSGCASAMPNIGDPCSADGEVCEYGPSWWLACNTVLLCTKGSWQKDPAYLGAAPCGEVDAGGACPASWAEASAIEAGLLCPAADCQYPEGYCECVSHCGGGGGKVHGSVSGSWRCQPAMARCPSPRPLLGTACSDSDADFCNYSWPCGCGQDLACQGGIWRGGPSPPCP